MMGQRFDDLRIGVKMALIAGVAVIGVFVFGAIYVLSENRLLATQDAVGRAMANRFAAGAAARLFGDAWLADREFARQPAAATVEVVLQALERSRKGLDEVHARPGSPAEQVLNKDRADLAAFRATFERSVRIRERIGFNEDDGLQGSMRQSVRAAEAALSRGNPAPLVPLLQMRRHEKDFLARGGAQYVAELDGSYREFLALLASPPAGNDPRIAIKDLVDAYHRDFHALVDAKLELQGQEDQLDALGRGLRQNIRVLVQAVTAVANDSEARLRADRSSAFWLIAAVILAMTLAVTGLAALVARRIVRPVGRLTATMDRLAAGDWGAEVADMRRKDEVGKMARAVEVFRDAGLTKERLQADLRRQQEWLRRVLDELPVGVTIFDEQERVMMRNSAMNRLHPHPRPERLIGLGVSELVHDVVTSLPSSPDSTPPADPGAFARDLEQKYRAAPEGRFETQFRSSAAVDVHFRWVDGKNLILVHSDVSALREAERRAADAEKLLQDVFENVPVGISMYDGNRRMALVNGYLRTLYGNLDTDALIGKTIDEVIDTAASFFPDTEDLRRLARSYKAFLNSAYTDTDPQVREMEVALPDGRTLAVRRRLLTDRNLLLISQIDITALRRSEQRANFAEKLLQDVFDNVPVGITMCDENHRVGLMNKYMERLYGVDRSKTLGKTIEESVGPNFDVILPGSANREARAAGYRDFLLRGYTEHADESFELALPEERFFEIRRRHLADKNWLLIAHSDITALRRSERRAEKAERYLKGVLESLPVGVSVYDRDERLVLRNERLSQMLPLPAALGSAQPTHEEILRVTPPTEVETDDGRVTAGDLATKAMMDAFRTRSEGIIRARVGEDRYVTTNFRNLPTGERVLAVVDVTEPVKARKAVERSERRLQEVIDALPVGLVLYSGDGVLRLHNREFITQRPRIAGRIKVGQRIEDLAGAIWDASRPNPPRFVGDPAPPLADTPQDRAAYIKRQSASLVSEKAGSFDIEQLGEVLRIKTTALKDGDVVRVSTNITDLREKEAEIRRLGETALAQRTAVLQQVLDSVPQAIAVVAPDRRVKFGNRSLFALLEGKVAPREIDGLALARLFEGAGIASKQATLLLGTTDEAVDVTLTSSANTPLRVRVIPVATGDLLILLSDLTAQRQQEAERLAQQERVLQAEKSQAMVTLAGSIAHDFNNLLAVILGFSSLAGDSVKRLSANLPAGAPDDAAAIASAIGNVIASAERGRRIVESLNVLAKERKVEAQVVDLRDVVRDGEKLLRVLFPASARLEVQVPDAPCRIRANGVQIEQIITNLCINAVHALKGRTGRIVVAVDTVDVDGGRAEGLRATGAARRQGTYLNVAEDGSIEIFAGVLSRSRHVRLRVADDGTGINEAVARQLFTPFFTTKEPGKGTGLGLSSVLEIVDTHRGGLHVRSRAGVGTMFMILLPEASSAVAEAAPGPAAARATPVPAPGAVSEAEIRTEARVLVVDDEERLVDLMTQVLQRGGYDVEGFTDPQAALERFTKDPDGFDLVITDQTMPGITGRDLIARLRALRPDMTAVVCTGHSPDVTQNGALPDGVRSILRKPYTPAALLEAVREALAPPQPAGAVH